MLLELLDTLAADFERAVEKLRSAITIAAEEDPIFLQRLLVFCVVYTAFILTSGLYLLFARRMRVKRHDGVILLLKLRTLSSLCLAACAAVHIMWHIPTGDDLYQLNVIISAYIMVSWLIHQQYVRAVEEHFPISHRGHVLVLVSWVLTVGALVYHSSYDVRVMGAETDTLEWALVVATWSMQAIYFSTLMWFVGEQPLILPPVTRTQRTRRRHWVSVTVREVFRKVRNFRRRSKRALSLVTLWWVGKLINRGAADKLHSANDLLELPASVITENVDAEFNRVSDQLTWRLAYCELTGDIPDMSVMRQRRPPLMKVLADCFGHEYFSLGLLRLLADLASFACPVFLSKLLQALESGSDLYNGSIYASLLCVCSLLTGLLTAHFNHHIAIVGLKMRSAIIMTIYRKVLSTNLFHLGKFNFGQIINFISTDIENIQDFCPHFHNIWSLPLQVFTSVYLLYNQVQIASLVGIFFGVMVIMVNFLLAKQITRLSNIILSKKDTRVKMMAEILSGIQALKLYAWERHFLRWILLVRNKEMAALSTRKNLDALCVYMWASSTVLISFFTFFVYVFWLDKTLSTAKVFTCLALFNVLLVPFNVLPWTISGLTEAWISVHRIEKLLQLPWMDRDKHYTWLTEGRRQPLINLTNAVFIWKEMKVPSRLPETAMFIPGTDVESVGIPMQKQFLLGPVSMDVYPGQFIGVYGRIGSGKSSLLLGLMAEMQRKRGTVALSQDIDSFGYVGQDFWLERGSVRDNIMFGSKFERDRYQTILEACCLLEDLKAMPGGDTAMIKEHGANLSGGQRARIALARAVYQNKQVYLLDDPFAGLDTNVAHHVFKYCIKKLLAYSTRIVCTHHMNFLYQTDYVLVLQDGRVIDKGPPAAVFAARSSVRLTYLSSLLNLERLEREAKEETTPTIFPKQEDGGGGTRSPKVNVSELNVAAAGVDMETIQQGSVKFAVYKQYFASVGYVLVLLILISFAVMQGTKNTADWWLAYWLSSYVQGTMESNRSLASYFMFSINPGASLMTGDLYSYNVFVQFNGTALSSVLIPQISMPDKPDTHGPFFVVYTLLVAVNSVSVLFRAFLFARGGTIGATVIHNNLLFNLLKAPMAFFDKSSSGKLMNAFSTDVNAVDDRLPFMFNIFVAQTFGLVGILVIFIYGLPMISVILFPLAFFYVRIQRRYLRAARAVKRISAATLSPLYDHFAESLKGAATIRSMKQEERYISDIKVYLDKSQQALYATHAVIVWLNLRLHMIGAAVIVGILVLALVKTYNGEFEYRGDDEQPDADDSDVEVFFKYLTGNDVYMKRALISLTVTYALAITNMLKNLVWSFTETDKEMISCERIFEFIKTFGTEKWVGSYRPDPGWPRSGSIVFQNVYMEYPSDEPGLALKNVSFHIQPGERVGVVGRTGAGKSSLLRALFRLEEVKFGKIFVDGLDISKLNLEDLRTSIASVPQHPFVFTGSVRDNLDPGHFHTSYELWNVLDRCRVVEAVHRIGGLDVALPDGGLDQLFSVGQKQLISLARALLANAQILCIDELGTRLDYDTDELVNEVIDTVFVGRTVLMVTHRIESVMKCHRVIVMNSGQLVELDNPNKLLKRQNSEFLNLANQAVSSHRTLLKQQSQTRYVEPVK